MTRYKTEEARNKARSRKKDYDKRAKIKDPLNDLGKHIKKIKA
jgi:hypothetical protein